ncbi:MAG: UPF0175 family protein [Candidatus Micrarchaeota archaeon]
MENLTVTTLRLEQKALREIDALAKMEQIDRTTILRQILAVGIREIKIKYALTLYQNGTVSAGKASELAGVAIWEFLDILKVRNIGFRTDEEHLAGELQKMKLQS